MKSWTPPALKFHPLKEIKATSALRAMLHAEEFWPEEILSEPAVYLKTTSGDLLFLTDPFLVKEVLTRNDGSILRSKLQQRFAGHGTGRENVITDTGKRSMIHRKALAPLFSYQRFNTYFPFIQKTIEEALKPIFVTAETEETIDVGRICVNATFGVIWQILFGEAGKLTPPIDAKEMSNMLYEAGLSGDMKETAKALKLSKERSMSLSPLSPLVPDTPFARNSTLNSQLTQKELEDNAQFLLTSGHESTALTITWALLILSHYQDEQESIADEIKNVVGDQPLTLDILHKLPKLNYLLNETMRLYPSGILINRETLSDISLGDMFVKKGTQLAICFYGMHRNKKYWDDPDIFRPERFNPANKNDLSAFLPFSTGHHSCLGDKLAWLEAMLVLSTILKDLQIISVNDLIKPLARYTLRPDSPVIVKVKRRN